MERAECPKKSINPPSGDLDAVVIVPPLVKYEAGPLLGPSMLVGAAEAAGMRARSLDLNIRYLRTCADRSGRAADSPLVGDHDRNSEALARIEIGWLREAKAVLPASPSVDHINVDAASAMLYEIAEVDAAAAAIASGGRGEWIGQQLADIPAPRMVGLSIMFSGQVLWALATAIVVRRVWPKSLIVAGGAHITALEDQIASETRYGGRIDRFVFGYAERTFVEILAALRDGRELPAECHRAGDGAVSRARADGSIVPRFDELEHYRTERVTLPAQYSRGCAYGKCRFCTYPAIEGGYGTLPEYPVREAVRVAEQYRGAVSFKDSLVVGKRLDRLGAIIAGRVPWSACTKLHGWLDASNLSILRRNGCSTLELGVETMVPGSQRYIDKLQSHELFESVLNAAGAANMPLVINTITGFPGEDPRLADAGLQGIRCLVERSLPELAKVQHNIFELERKAPLAKDPSIRVTRSWPWSSLLDWTFLPATLERRVALTVLGG